jgi:hypothetical protein
VPARKEKLVAGKADGYREAERRLLRRRLDRASFLRLIGAGATLSFVPASLVARPSSAQTTGPEILSQEGEYPIGVWSPPPPRETTAARYAEIANAGFNFVIGGNGVNTTDLHRRALDAAWAHNNSLGFFLTDNILQNAIKGEVSPDRQDAVTKRLTRLLDDYRAHPALAGLNLYDEPNSRLFGILAYAKRELRRLAPQELLYVNVWPSYAAPRALGARTYGKYLNRYLSAVSPPLLSFDHYPLLSKGITSDYFYNWAVIRNVSRRFGVPSRGFIQSVGFDGRKVGLSRRRKPTKNELFWQINVALAYGAKGLQYFTYWNPVDPQIRFGNALINSEGDQTDLYGYAQKANGYLKKVGKELLPLKSESVVHAKERRLPRGAKAFRADGYVNSVGGDPVILGRFSNPDVSTEQYLFVANRSLANSAITLLTMSAAVSSGVVERLDLSPGVPDKTYVPVPLEGTSSRRILQVTLKAGRAELYRLRTA